MDCLTTTISSARNEAYITKTGDAPVAGGSDTPNVSYKTHVQTHGWQGLKYNGQMSGTSGQAKRLEGIQIVLVPKGNAAPADDYGGIVSVNRSVFVRK